MGYSTEKLQMDMFQQYKEMYEQELKTREVLYSRLNIPLAIILVLLGLLSFYAKSYKMGPSVSALDAIFLASVLLATVFLGIAIYFFFRSFSGYRHGEILTADEIEKYREGYRRQLEEYYKKYYGGDVALMSKIGEKIDDATKRLFYTYYQRGVFT